MAKSLSKYSAADIMAPTGAPVPDSLAPFLKAIYVPRGDIKLRVLIAAKPDAAPRGTIIISPGRTEFIEKYFELVENFLSRRFTVMVIDHRGQGLSSRLLEDPLKSYVGQFQDYADDLGYVIDELGAHLPKPHVVLSHSMGGCIALQPVISGTINPALMICSAPMLSIFEVDTPILRGIIRVSSLFGQSEKHLPFSKRKDGMPVAYKGNKLTSDRVRFDRWASYFTHVPSLRLAGPTIGWVNASLNGMKFVNRNAAQVKTPTLIISAGADPIVDPSTHKTFAEKSGAMLKVVPGARHELFLEQDEYRDQFLKIVDDYLEAQAL